MINNEHLIINGKFNSSIISSPEIKIGYDLPQIDIIALSMLLRIRNFLLLCDQSQSYMILLQYPKIENILELITIIIYYINFY